MSKSSSPMGKIYPKRIKETIQTGESSKKQFSFSKNTNANIIRKIGDIWYDKDDYMWEQMDGWVKKHPKIGNLGMPLFCPKCNNIIKNTKLNEKMWYLRGKCFNCVSEEEHEIRKNGSWKEYENKKIIQNKIAFLKDALSQSEEYLNTSLKKSIEYHNEDGSIENWNNENYTAEQNFVKKQISDIKILIDKYTEVLNGNLTEDDVLIYLENSIGK